MQLSNKSIERMERKDHIYELEGNDKVRYSNLVTGKETVVNIYDAIGVDPKTWKDIETPALKEYIQS